MYTLVLFCWSIKAEPSTIFFWEEFLVSWPTVDCSISIWFSHCCMRDFKLLFLTSIWYSIVLMWDVIAFWMCFKFLCFWFFIRMVLTNECFMFNNQIWLSAIVEFSNAVVIHRLRDFFPTKCFLFSFTSHFVYHPYASYVLLPLFCHIFQIISHSCVCLSLCVCVGCA